MCVIIYNILSNILDTYNKTFPFSFFLTLYFFSFFTFIILNLRQTICRLIIVNIKLDIDCIVSRANLSFLFTLLTLLLT